jgi:hypothetical protein
MTVVAGLLLFAGLAVLSPTGARAWIQASDASSLTIRNARVAAERTDRGVVRALRGTGVTVTTPRIATCRRVDRLIVDCVAISGTGRRCRVVYSVALRPRRMRLTTIVVPYGCPRAESPSAEQFRDGFNMELASEFVVTCPPTEGWWKCSYGPGGRSRPGGRLLLPGPSVFGLASLVLTESQAAVAVNALGAEVKFMRRRLDPATRACERTLGARDTRCGALQRAKGYDWLAREVIAGGCARVGANAIECELLTMADAGQTDCLFVVRSRLVAGGYVASLPRECPEGERLSDAVPRDALDTMSAVRRWAGSATGGWDGPEAGWRRAGSGIALPRGCEVRPRRGCPRYGGPGETQVCWWEVVRRHRHPSGRIHPHERRKCRSG